MLYCVANRRPIDSDDKGFVSFQVIKRYYVCFFRAGVNGISWIFISAGEDNIHRKDLFLLSPLYNVDS